MTISTNQSGTAFDACLEEGTRQSQNLIQGWCASLAERLYGRSKTQADPAQRRTLQNVAAALKENRAFIEAGFVKQLEAAVRDEIHQAGGRQPDRPANSFSALSFDQLELMGDNQVQEAVESARLQQQIKLASEAGLVGFSARLSTAQGFDRVRTDKNPWRPEVVSQVLFALLKTTPVANHMRASWLGNGAQLMGEQLHLFYVALDRMLAEQGVLPAPYGVLSTAQVRGGTSAAFAADPATEPAAQAPVVSPSRLDTQLVTAGHLGQSVHNKLLTLDRLHHLLVGDYDASFKGLAASSDGNSDAPLHSDFAHTVPNALDMLMELEKKGITPVSRANDTRSTPLPLAQMRAHLKTDAKTLGQSLAIEVIGLMIKQLADDDRLLMPVRQVIVNAEPAFLRLAVTDPRFFSDKTHPARRLLDVITSASLAYASEDTAGFAEFMATVQQTAALLTEEHASDAQHFAGLLQTFEKSQARQSQQYLEPQRRAVQALLQAEQRNLLAEKIASEIHERPDFVEGNRIITSFLTGPWSQVIASERLRGEHGQAGLSKALYGRTLDDLLWSLDPAKVLNHQKRLLKIIPHMLESLREGLLSIAYPLEHSRSFFDELMLIHRAGLRVVAPRSDTSGKPRSELADMFSSDDALESSRPWLAPAEAQHTGFIDDSDDQVGSAPSAAFQQQGMPEGAALQLGDWVELLVDLRWLRAQLTWISPHNTLFMFTSEGGRKHSMTARVLNHLQRSALVKVVSHQGVLDGALDGVARTAMRNSLVNEPVV